MYEQLYSITNLFSLVSHYPPGYSRVAAIQACDPSLLVYRKFGWLRNLLLLDLQDQIQDLEEGLERHLRDQFDCGQEVRLTSRRVDYSKPGSRKQEIIEIAEKLQEYGMYP